MQADYNSHLGKMFDVLLLEMRGLLTASTLYRVTIQVGPNLPLTSKQARLGQAKAELLFLSQLEVWS